MGKGKSKRMKKLAKKLGLPFKNFKLKKCKVTDGMGLPFPTKVGKDEELYNLAADYVINEDLRKSGITFMDELPQADKMTTEQVYETLRRHEAFHAYYEKWYNLKPKIQWVQKDAYTWSRGNWEVTFHEVVGLFSVAHRGKQIDMMPFQELKAAQDYCD